VYVSSASSSRPALLYVSPSVVQVSNISCFRGSTYSPSIAVFEASGGNRTVDLASEPTCQATVAIHHFLSPSQRFPWAFEGSGRGRSRTLSVPLVDRVSGALATVLDVSDL